MSVKIDPPGKRSLTHNERKILELLQAGNTPLEIAKKLHMPLKSSFYGSGDMPPDTVLELICGIREKGWEIPGEKISDENEEVKIMPKGTPIPPEKTEQIKALRAAGKSYGEIEKQCGISHSTAQRICKKSEPAPAATDAGSDGKSIAKNSDTKIISENSEVVKPSDEKFSGYSRELLEKRIWDIDLKIDTLNYERKALIADYKKMGGKL